MHSVRAEVTSAAEEMRRSTLLQELRAAGLELEADAVRALSPLCLALTSRDTPWLWAELREQKVCKSSESGFVKRKPSQCGVVWDIPL